MHSHPNCQALPSYLRMGHFQYQHPIRVCRSLLTRSALQVNDDYCDCQNGMDEPGTSACSQQGAHFACASTRQVISTSFVVDGFRCALSLAVQAVSSPDMRVTFCMP